MMRARDSTRFASLARFRDDLTGHTQYGRKSRDTTVLIAPAQREGTEPQGACACAVRRGGATRWVCGCAVKSLRGRHLAPAQYGRSRDLGEGRGQCRASAQCRSQHCAGAFGSRLGFSCVCVSERVEGRVRGKSRGSGLGLGNVARGAADRAPGWGRSASGMHARCTVRPRGLCTGRISSAEYSSSLQAS